MELQNPTPRDKRIVEAHRRRYEQNQSLEEIAEAMGYSYDTIRDYFREESAERIKQLYDENELEFLRLKLFDQVEKSTQNAEKHLNKAARAAEDSKEYRSIVKEEQKIPERRIKMLQELGLLDKPKERKEVEQTSTGPANVSVNMELVESDEEVEQSDG